MNECSYLLLIFFIVSINSTIHSLPNAIIEHVCENDFLTLQCSQSNETIQIIRSMYGRTSQRICNQHLIDRVWEKTCANIEQSKYQTKSRCQGKSTCEILINNQIFTDPCGENIPKHFEIHYRCIHREDVCMKLFINCSKSKDLQCVKNIEAEFSCQCPSNICQYVDEKFVGFIENICPEEKLQGFHWPKTLINKNRSLPCPSPCTGEVSRICHSNHQWSIVNYTHCQCPIDTFDQVKTSSLSTHHSASSYIFQCNFWLINRILPEENSCLHSFVNWQDATTEPLMCLLNAFEHMHFQSCFNWKKSFAIEFANLAFEIALPSSNENRLELFSKQIIVDRTEIIRDNFRAHLPMMMMIDKTTRSHSIILVEQENDFNSLQTANVTLTFHHQSAEIRYQCRAYHSTNFSLNLNSSNMFFACQLLCSNGSHVICQCPFFNPFMQYILQIDRSQTENELLIENDLNERCVGEERVTPTDKIDRYLNEIPSLTFVKKLLLFIERTIDKRNLMSNWKIIQQIQSLAIQIQQITDSFISISNHLELFLQSNVDQFENSDRSIVITIHPSMKDNSMLFFTLSNIHTHLIFNSRIVTLKSMSKNISIDHIQFIFRHRNQSYPMSTCANLNDQMQWTTDECQLIATNLTHTICSCRDWSTVALLMDFSKPMSKSITDNRLLFISKIGSVISIICVLLTIFILLLIRSHVNINDDLTHIRNILHTNMFFCLIFVQILFLFGIDQMKNQIYCRMSSILLDYFLLATFSWMFVDGIELLIAVKHMFQIDRIRLIAYSIYSYGFPLLIIVLSIGFSSKASSGLSRYCWLSHDNAFIWAFGIPFMLLILGNLGLFLMSICAICSNSDVTEYKKRLRHSLRDISLLSILFGITWLLAMFYLYDQTIFLAYVFTTLNSVHGFLILVVYYFSPVHFRILLEKLHLCQIYCRSFFDCFRSNHPTHNKSLECFSLPDTTSSSDYSSGHSFDLNGKHVSCQQAATQQFLTRSTYNHRRITSNNEPCYLPSVSINLLSNRLSTFRYPLPTNEVLLAQEQNEELLGKTSLPSEDDHQYYEIR